MLSDRAGIPNLVGERVGKYQLLARLGATDLWTVYKGYYHGGYDYVAVKIVHTSHQAQADEHLTTLPDWMGSLDHPSIARVYDTGIQDDYRYLVCEFLDGVTLAEELAARQEQHAPFSLDEVTYIVQHIAQAIDYAHDHGWVHGTIRPESILFTWDGFPVLIDFERAQLVKPTGPPMTKQADIAALGGITRQLLNGRAEFSVNGSFSRAAELVDALPASSPTITGVSSIAQTKMAKQITVATDHPHQFKAMPGICPYQGLFAFREENAAFFFGREAFIDQLVNVVQRKPIVMVTGASGSGKSSVVYAGLVPYLRQSGGWEIVDLRPGPQPIYALAGAVSPLLAADMSAVERKRKNHRLASAMLTGEAALEQYVAQIMQQGEAGRHMLLVLDQFEELYTLCDDEARRNRFLDILLAAAESPLVQRQLRIVLTLRADFLGQALAHRGFADSLHQADIKLGPMNPSELVRAIENPAARQGVTFEDGLVKRILRDVGDDLRTLPLLQFALTQLWTEQSDGQLTHQGYELINGATGALARYADLIYQSLDDKDQAQAQRVFMQLVRPGIGTEDTRRLAYRSELDEADWQLVQQLADARLVVLGRTADGQETVEVVHEALIREWQQLRAWLNEDRAFRTWQDRLRTALHQWEASDQDEGAFLRGALLIEAEGWLAERQSDLTPVERTFILESIALREQREAQQREAQRARENSRRVAISALTVGLVVAVLLALFSWQQSQTARNQQIVALSNQLSAQALSRLEGQEYDLAHLLSLQAYQMHSSAESRNALLVTLQRSPYRLILRHYENPVVAAVPSSTARLLVTLQADGTVDLTDTDARRVISRLPDAHAGRITSVALSPDDRRLASADSAGQIIIWNIEELENPQVLRQMTQETLVSAVVFSPNGKTLAVGGANSQIVLWDVTAGQPLHAPLVGHTGDVRSLAFSPNGRWLASGSINEEWAAADESVILWDLNTDTIRRYRLRGLTNNVSDISFSADGRVIAAGSTDGTIILWNVQTREATGATLLHNVEEQSASIILPEIKIALSPDGQTLASGDVGGTIILWNLATGRPLGEPLQAGEGAIHDLAFSREGHTLVSADNTVVLWAIDQRLGESLATVTSRVWSLAFNPAAEEQLVIGGEDGTVLMWDTLGVRAAGHPLPGHEEHVNSVAISPSDAILASGSDDRTVRLWDMTTGDLLYPILVGHTDSVMDVAFSPDGQILASAGRDDSIILWDMVTYKPVTPPLVGHTDDVWQVAFSADGSTLASASWDGTIRVWDVASGDLLMPPLAAHNGPVLSIAISPTAPRMASVSRDGALIIWDLTTGQPINTLWQGRPGTGWQVAFSPDGQLLASAGCAQTTVQGDCALGEIRLWDVEAERQLGQPFTGHGDVAWAIAFSPQGDKLVSASRDGSIVTWDVSLSSWMQKACGIANRSLTQAEWQRYLGGEVYEPACNDGRVQ